MPWNFSAAEFRLRSSDFQVPTSEFRALIFASRLLNFDIYLPRSNFQILYITIFIIGLARAIFPWSYLTYINFMYSKYYHQSSDLCFCCGSGDRCMKIIVQADTTASWNDSLRKCIKITAGNGTLASLHSYMEHGRPIFTGIHTYVYQQSLLISYHHNPHTNHTNDVPKLSIANIFVCKINLWFFKMLYWLMCSESTHTLLIVNICLDAIGLLSWLLENNRFYFKINWFFFKQFAGSFDRATQAP